MRVSFSSAASPSAANGRHGSSLPSAHRESVLVAHVTQRPPGEVTFTFPRAWWPGLLLRCVCVTTRRAAGASDAETKSRHVGATVPAGQIQWPALSWIHRESCAAFQRRPLALHNTERYTMGCSLLACWKRVLVSFPPWFPLSLASPRIRVAAVPAPPSHPFPCRTARRTCEVVMESPPCYDIHALDVLRVRIVEWEGCEY